MCELARMASAREMRRKNDVEHVSRNDGGGGGVDENDEFEILELALYKLYTSFASNMLCSDGIGSADAYFGGYKKEMTINMSWNGSGSNDKPNALDAVGCMFMSDDVFVDNNRGEHSNFQTECENGKKMRQSRIVSRCRSLPRPSPCSPTCPHG